MTLIKICGITNIKDAEAAVLAGADQVGFNFFPASPRFTNVESAKKIGDRIGSRATKVGVFVNESVDRIREIAAEARLEVIQLHGDEDEGFIGRLRTETGLSITKAVRVTADFDPTTVSSFNADAILLDSYSREARGGTGMKFDWSRAIEVSKIVDRLYLAGGLAPENVAEAIRIIRPFAVDTCSGVESEPGKKDPLKLIRFIENARKQDEI